MKSALSLFSSIPFHRVVAGPESPFFYPLGCFCAFLAFWCGVRVDGKSVVVMVAVEGSSFG